MRATRRMIALRAWKLAPKQTFRWLPGPVTFPIQQTHFTEVVVVDFKMWGPRKRRTKFGKHGGGRLRWLRKLRRWGAA